MQNGTVISVELARELREAGLRWEPRKGDHFIIMDRDMDDEVFVGDAGSAPAGSIHGEAALIASLNAHRTGRMSDIVATIQAEQDQIIRAPLKGILVVQGGPGTGKTVAALHRAAYLLYTHRDQLERSGVLVIGPNTTFMRYIDQVLPSLGETGVNLTTVGGLLPGVEAELTDGHAMAVIKGDLRMAGVVGAAVRYHQRVPRKPIRLEIDGVGLELEPGVVRTARTRARRARRSHNEARPVFILELLRPLALQYLERSGQAVDDDELADMRAELAGHPDVRAVLDELWPALSPRNLVAALLTDPKLLAASARSLDPEERQLLLGSARGPDGPWSEADIPLLDEAAELLGDVPDQAALAAVREAEKERRAEQEFAADLLTGLDLGFPVDAAQVAERYRGTPAGSTTDQRAAQDRTWAYGHVIMPLADARDRRTQVVAVVHSHPLAVGPLGEVSDPTEFVV
jgi:DNA helicase IV